MNVGLGNSRTCLNTTTCSELQISEDDTQVFGTHTHTHVSGFKWRERSLCHGSMMDHYGWVTSGGKRHKAH